MVTATRDDVDARAHAFATTLAGIGVACDVVASEGAVGGGAFPTARLASAAIRLSGDARAWDDSLRHAGVPVVGRIADDAMLLDMRTVQPHEEILLLESVRSSAP
jgi:L-seryl-tRNA(Ser) seleniumtransferase